MKHIVLKGVKENNLKNIDVDIPRGQITVLTGISGSGKSTLAFDTIFAEGQRRYLESLSSYARQFVDRFKKPDLEYISGLSPSVSVNQKTFIRNPRSTVATITEIYDFLRLLYSRLGQAHCYKCNTLIEKASPSSIIDTIKKDFHGEDLEIYFPLAMGSKGEFKNELALMSKFFSTVRIDGKVRSLGEKIILEKQKKHTIEVYIDSIKIMDENFTRLRESIDTALQYGEGLVLVETNEEERIFNQNLACNNCGLTFPEVSPRLFSFNSPYGCCEECEGIGYFEYFDEDLVVPDRSRSIKGGAIKPLKDSQFYKKLLKDFLYHQNIDDSQPFEKLSKKNQDLIFYGNTKTTITDFIKKYESIETSFDGIINILEKWFSSSKSDEVKDVLGNYRKIEVCNTCKGSRLKPHALSVLVNDLNIFQVCSMPVSQCLNFIKRIKFKNSQQIIWERIKDEIINRLEFLCNVGLNYLTLNRTAPTLSGGEAQRIRLASQLGAKLTGITYVLDEPTIGLHPRDNKMLAESLQLLKKRGNTVIVVEHDEETIRSSDYIIDLGPGAGFHGGSVVAMGRLSDISKNKSSVTGRYLAGHRKINTKRLNKNPDKYFEIIGASLNNLKKINIRIPIGRISCVTGVSGSGKSTLVVGTISQALPNYLLSQKKKLPPFIQSIKGYENFDKIISINQAPIGRTPRSNPATYIGIFSTIREIFASLQQSKMKGFSVGRFSFNVKEGSCPECSGAGSVKIAMNFLPDVNVTCELCDGKRFDSETLKVTYKEKNIADILHMTFEEAENFFSGFPALKSKIEIINSVGLGYLQIGQAATTLSGGEAQRIKLSRELIKKNMGRGLYILDEPTIGLHFSDVDKLLGAIYQLRESGNTVVIIEHNMDIINACDYIIDLGPGGGEDGGRVLFQGPIENFENCKKSETAYYLRKHLDRLIRSSKVRNNKAKK